MVEDVAPNLIPMVDIMFLLLLFFMLGADMGQRELEEVKLPKTSFAKKDQPDDPSQKLPDRLTLNIYHRYASEVRCDAYAADRTCRDESHWRVAVRGDAFRDFAHLAEKLGEEARRFPEPGKAGVSSRRVMIRADAAAPFGLVQRAMNACAQVRIYKVECGSAMPPEVKKAGAARG
jgi:biopolymer transport protein ExbD